jgi:hypothetical protein
MLNRETMSDAVTIDDDRRLMMQLVGQYDAPAYIRRARAVEHAHEQILERCQRQRREWLAGVRLHLKWLSRAIGDADLDSASIDAIRQLRRECEFTGRETQKSGRGIATALRQLRASVARFNRRWATFVDRLDLAEINRLREGYNRYYILEKECAVGSLRLVGTTFRRLEPMTCDELHRLFPPLPMP